MHEMLSVCVRVCYIAVKQRECELLGAFYIPDRPVNLQDILRAVSHLSNRIGPDPFPPESDQDVFDPDLPATWCTNTWDDENIGRRYLLVHIYS